MNDFLYYALCGICVTAVLLGINMMSKVKTAVQGNALSAGAMLLAMVLIFLTRGEDADTAAIIGLCLALAA